MFPDCLISPLTFFHSQTGAHFHLTINEQNDTGAVISIIFSSKQGLYFFQNIFTPRGNVSVKSQTIFPGKK